MPFLGRIKACVNGRRWVRAVPRHLPLAGRGMAHMDSLVFRTAQKHVRNYSHEADAVMAEHRQAMDCRDCETFLQIAIDAFDWVARADADVRLAVYEGEQEYDPSFDEALLSLYRRWLDPCERAQSWIAVQQKRGFVLDNIGRFRVCCEEVRAIVKAATNPTSSEVSDALIELRDEAIDAFRNGQTAEFF